MTCIESYILNCLNEYGENKNKASLIYSKGVNNSPYRTQKTDVFWFDAHYKTWTGMLRRCLSDKFRMKNQHYSDCIVSEDWLEFMNFLNWSFVNKVDGWHLDKDLLFENNKLYSSKTCAYVPPYLNCLFKQKAYPNGLPLGVSAPRCGKNEGYKATISNGNKCRSLGMFTDPQSAHAAWQLAKIESINDSLSRYKKEPLGFRDDVLCAIVRRRDRIVNALLKCEEIIIV